MNIKKILCPIDLSEFNIPVNEFASLFAASTGAEIVYLHIAEQGAYNGDYTYAMERTAERLLKKLVGIKPTSSGIKFSHEVIVCSWFADTIIKYAKQQNVDLIILATHGRTGLQRILLGSVAEAVVRGAHCAVATIRPHGNFFKNRAELDSSTDNAAPEPKKSLP